MEKLELCPFCGGEAVTDIQVTQMGGSEFNPDIISLSISCEKCGTYKSRRVILKHKQNPFEKFEEAKNAVINDWNTRYKE